MRKARVNLALSRAEGWKFELRGCSRSRRVGPFGQTSIRPAIDALRNSAVGRKHFQLSRYRLSLKIVALKFVQNGPMPSPRRTIAFSAGERAEKPAEPSSLPTSLPEAAVESRNSRIVPRAFRRPTKLPEHLEFRMAPTEAVDVICLALTIRLTA